MQAKNKSHRIAHMAMITAVSVVVNMFEVRLGGVKFSLTILISTFAGLYLGALSGFGCCFLGDTIEFLISPKGEYSPWVGICNGLMAFIIGVCILLPYARKWLHFYLGVACILIFCICTCGINTWYLNKIFAPSLTHWEYLPVRLFAQGQIWNSIVNSVLAIVCLPLLVKVKPLRINV